MSNSVNNILNNSFSEYLVNYPGSNVYPHLGSLEDTFSITIEPKDEFDEDLIEKSIIKFIDSLNQNGYLKSSNWEYDYLNNDLPHSVDFIITNE